MAGHPDAGVPHARPHRPGEAVTLSDPFNARGALRADVHVAHCPGGDFPGADRKIELRGRRAVAAVAHVESRLLPDELLAFVRPEPVARLDDRELRLLLAEPPLAEEEPDFFVRFGDFAAAVPRLVPRLSVSTALALILPLVMPQGSDSRTLSTISSALGSRA